MLQTMKALLLGLAVLASSPNLAQAQLATLTRDLATEASDNQGSDPQPLAVFGNRLVMLASEPTVGRELWAVDLETGEPEMLASSCADCRVGREPEILAVTPRYVYWFVQVTDSGNLEHQLWRTDGTRQGTLPLTTRELAPQIDTPLDPTNPPTVGDRLVFVAYTPEARRELWVTDGTPEGTELLIDLAPGNGFADPFGLTRLGSRVLFFARDATTFGLWATDGTAGGTTLLAAVPSPVDRFRIVKAGSRLFFAVQTFPTVRSEWWLWTSDGTAAGTREVARLSPTGIERGPEWLEAAGDRVFFPARDGDRGIELWTSDGTARGTKKVTSLTQLNPWARIDGIFPLNHVVPFAGRFYFAARERSLVRLFSVGPSFADVREELNLEPGGCSAGVSGRLVPVGGKLAFSRCVGSAPELWVTDGRSSGTLSLGPLSVFASSPAGFGPIPGSSDLVFGRNTQLFRTDGTVANTRPIARPGRWRVDDVARGLLWRGESVWYAFDNGSSGVELWRSDGSPASSRLLLDLAKSRPGFDPAELTPWGAGIAFGSANFTSSALWTSDGSRDGTQELAESVEAECFGLDSDLDLARAGERLLLLCRGSSGGGALAATDATNGLEVLPLDNGDGSPPSFDLMLDAESQAFMVSSRGPFRVWRSDGTAAGTYGLLSDDQLAFRLLSAKVINDELYFLGFDTEHGTELWKTDGTVDGTLRLSDVEGAEIGFFGLSLNVIRLGDHVYFPARETETVSLWRVHRDLGGAERLFDVAAIGGSGILGLTAFGSALYFSSFDAASESYGLWRSDGTLAGTTLLRSGLHFDTGLGRSVELVGSGARLYFVASTESLGSELWSTDGTPEGTRLVADLFAGAANARPEELTAAPGGRLFFLAQTSVVGRELWATDGTAEGTRLVHDIAPGPASSSPGQLTLSGDRLFFTADDGLHGRELWSLPLVGDGGCQGDALHVCLGGRFRAELAWRDFQDQPGDAFANTLTSDTGYFHFVNPANVEIVAKALDGRGVNGHHWLFYGALSNTEYHLTVADAETGLSRRWYNPPRRFASRGDTTAFGPLGANLNRHTPPAEEVEAFLPSPRQSLAPRGSCAPSSTRLCLSGGRFAVEATWRDFAGNQGQANTSPLTADTGTFWFFDAANVELVTKVVDGRPLNGHFWFFYGALSNVEYTLSVTDTETGEVRSYTNPLRTFGSRGDTEAF